MDKQKRPTGRPSIRTPELEKEILTLLMEGESLTRICERPEMPCRNSVLHWIGIDPAFCAEYLRARESQAEVLQFRMADVEDRTLSGEIDPAAARAVLGSMQWRASKLAPKRYGERLGLEHSGAVDLAGAILAARKRSGRDDDGGE